MFNDMFRGFNFTSTGGRAVFINMELACTNFDDRKLAGHEKSVEEKEKDNGNNNE